MNYIEKYKTKIIPRYSSKMDFLEKVKNDKEHIMRSMDKAWRQYGKYPDRQWVVIYLDRYQVPSYVVDFTLGIENITDVHLERYGIPLFNFNYKNCNVKSEVDYEELWNMCINIILDRPKLEKDYSVFMNPNEAQNGQITLFG